MTDAGPVAPGYENREPKRTPRAMTAASVRGWSYVLSSLKTVVETGEPLPPLV